MARWRLQGFAVLCPRTDVGKIVNIFSLKDTSRCVASYPLQKSAIVIIGSDDGNRLWAQTGAKLRMIGGLVQPLTLQEAFANSEASARRFRIGILRQDSPETNPFDFTKIRKGKSSPRGGHQPRQTWADNKGQIRKICLCWSTNAHKPMIPVMMYFWGNVYPASNYCQTPAPGAPGSYRKYVDKHGNRK
jgi:hypothetical protein